MGITNLDSLTLDNDLVVGGDVDITGDVAITGAFSTTGVYTPTGGVLIEGSDKIELRDTGIYLNSPSDGTGQFVADTAMNLTGPTTDITASTASTITSPVITLAGRTSAKIDPAYYCAYYDDFLEAANAIASTTVAKAYWTGGGTSGTQATIANANGIMELSTTATGSRTSTLTWSGAGFDNDLTPVYETRFKLNDITNTKMEVGLYVDGNDYLMLRFDTAVDAGNIYVVSDNDNAGEVVTDSGVDLVAGTYVTLRIAIAADDSYVMYLNDVAVTGIELNTIRDAGLKPYFYVDNKDQAEEKLLDIDYVAFWNARS